MVLLTGNNKVKTAVFISGTGSNLKNLIKFSIKKNSVDFYASVKSLYTQDRENKIKNIQRGSIEVIYKEDGDWEEIDNK